MRRTLCIVLALIAAGCAVAPPQPSEPESPKEANERRARAALPTYNLTGYPPAVREGYIDGCETAKKSEFARKDTKRMAGDPQYSMGWNDGFGICGKKP
jgi:hypothetical protein